MGERAAPVDVAERPNARHVGAQFIVHGYVTACVGLDAGLVESEVIGIGHAPDRQQQMRARDFARFLFATHLHRDAVAAFRRAHALGIEPDFDALALQNVGDRGRYFFVLASYQPRPHFHHRDAAAETPVHLRKLESDVTAADDDQMRRQKIDVHHARIGKVGNVG